MSESEIKTHIPSGLPLKKGRKKAGLPPGSLVYIGSERKHKPSITLFNYTRDGYTEKKINTINECLPLKNANSVTWINVDGVHDVEEIEKIGNLLEIHPLILEDMVNTHQRPKADDYDDLLYIVLRMLTYDVTKHRIDSEQLSIVLSKQFVISFQEKEGDFYDPIRERIRDNKSKIRDFGNDYLVYRIMDITVDHYFVLMEEMGERIELLEEKILKNCTGDILVKIEDIKKDIMLIRRSVYPLREVLGKLSKEENMIHKKTMKFMRDVHEHTVQIIESLEMFRDMVTGLKESYHSQLNIEMNKTIQTLTIITTIFIPLSFITGVFGMNFHHMIGIDSRYGFYITMAVMAILSIWMLFYFRKRRWL